MPQPARRAELRRFVMANCNLHTILRLPTGIFYAQGVKTNVLFFTRVTDEIMPADHATSATSAIWFYDLRTKMPAFGKTNPLRPDDFADFEASFGPDPLGGGMREDEGEEGRWRRFSREEFAGAIATHLQAAQAERALKLLGHLDQRILERAFSGGLVSQNPKDEPAAALLARIKASQARPGRRQ